MKADIKKNKEEAEESVSAAAEEKVEAADIDNDLKKDKKGKKKNKKAQELADTDTKANLSLFVTFVVSLVLDSLLLRLFTVKFGDSHTALTIIKSIIKPMLADAFAVMLIGSIGFAFAKQRGRFRYLITWTFIFSILAIANSIYYTNYKSFVSVSEAATGSQLGGVIDAVTKNILEPKDFLLLFPIPVMFFANHRIKKKNGKDYIKKPQPRVKLNKFAAVACAAAVACGGIFSTMLTKTDCSRLVKQWNRESVLANFGLYVYQISDTISSAHVKINMMFGYEKSKKKFDEFFDSKSDSNTGSEVIDEVKNDKDNEYSNIFKGKNVIVIHAESIQQFTMDTYINGEELTPNLNKIAKEGLYFSNFYTQESVGTSSDSEFTFSTSLMPASSGTVAINYWDRDYASTQKKFKEMGYYVFSMHGNNGSYWNRLNLHESLGYDRLYNYNNDFIIDETIGLGLSDKSFFRQAVPMIKDIKKKYGSFYGALIMLTNHTPFTDIERVSDYEVDFKYRKYNEETGMYEEISAPFLEGTKLGSYFKSVHYADEAIGQLMEDLEKEGLLDNTVLVIYGDHDAKIKEEQYEYYYNYNPFTEETLTDSDPGYIPVDEFYYNINRKTPFIIWSKGGEYEPKEITRVMGMYDVQPTLGNMFGFKNEYAMGHDIFSFGDDEENTVIFPNGNFITDSVYYDSQKEVYFDLTGYENVAKYASCNQAYKDNPFPMFDQATDGLYKFSPSDYSAENAELRKNDGSVDTDYIEKRFEYASDRIDVSNSIIYYDIINKVKEGFDDVHIYEPADSVAEPFSPPDMISRKRAYAV